MNMRLLNYASSLGFAISAFGMFCAADVRFKDGSTIGGVVFSAVGLVLGGVGLFVMFGKQFGNLHSPEEIAMLKGEGLKLMTKFAAIDRRWNIHVNGRSPIVVYSRDDQGRVYQSDDFWFSGADSAAYSDPASKRGKVCKAQTRPSI